MLRATIQYIRSPEFTAKEFRGAVTFANSETVEFWHNEYLPAHFTVAGGKKYGYQKRSGDDEPPRIVGKKGRLVTNFHYSWRKRRKFGHNKPLVWSGASEAAAKSAIKITASANRATGTFPSLPRYMYQYKPNQPDKADEMTRVVEDEVQAMALHHERACTEYLERLTEETTVVAA